MRALLSSILPLTALSLAACATKPARPTTPVQYTCGEITVDRAGTGLTIGSPIMPPLSGGTTMRVITS